MTDQEFIELLQRNITLIAEYNKGHWDGAPYLLIKLVVPQKGNGDEAITLASVRIDADDLKASD